MAAASRDSIERDILVNELRWIEARALDTRLVAISVTFSSLGDRTFGLHLNDANVILRIELGGLADEEGTLCPGDRIIAVNSSPLGVGDNVKDLISGHDCVTFVVARRVATSTDLATAVIAAADVPASSTSEGPASNALLARASTDASIGVSAEAVVGGAAPAATVPPASAPRTPASQLAKEKFSSVQNAVSDFARRFAKKDGSSHAKAGNSIACDSSGELAEAMSDHGTAARLVTLSDDPGLASKSGKESSTFVDASGCDDTPPSTERDIALADPSPESMAPGCAGPCSLSSGGADESGADGRSRVPSCGSTSHAERRSSLPPGVEKVLGAVRTAAQSADARDRSSSAPSNTGTASSASGACASEPTGEASLNSVTPPPPPSLVPASTPSSGVDLHRLRADVGERFRTCPPTHAREHARNWIPVAGRCS